MEETTSKVLETMRSAGKPVSAGEVATLSWLNARRWTRLSPSSRRTAQSYHPSAASGSLPSKAELFETD